MSEEVLSKEKAWQIDRHKHWVVCHYPKAKLRWRNGGRASAPRRECRVVVEQITGRDMAMTGWCKTELGAWKSVASRLPKYEEDDE
jgi:hypothetical protein